MCEEGVLFGLPAAAANNNNSPLGISCLSSLPHLAERLTVVCESRGVYDKQQSLKCSLAEHRLCAMLLSMIDNYNLFTSGFGRFLSR